MRGQNIYSISEREVGNRKTLLHINMRNTLFTYDTTAAIEL